MATKNTKLAGNSYWVNAAKQFVWPIDEKEKSILVPQSELELAEQDLMVLHFRNNGWHVQSVIGDVNKKKVFTTDGLKSEMPIFRPIIKEVAEVKLSRFTLNNRFKIVSTDCELKITHIESGKIHLSYTNKSKPDLLTSEENLNKVLRMGVWIEL
jgi:hypothetical protein